jgi:hypothetical protein
VKQRHVGRIEIGLKKMKKKEEEGRNEGRGEGRRKVRLMYMVLPGWWRMEPKNCV